MASISSYGGGKRMIQWVGANGKRQTLRFGDMPLKDVREIACKIESLNAAAVSRRGWDNPTAEWVASIDVSTLYDKLAKKGLLAEKQAAEVATLGPFMDDYLARRVDIKPRTRMNLTEAKRNLVLYFGADMPLDKVTPGDADLFRLWLAHEVVKLNGRIVKGKLASNTVRRQCGRARQLFRVALKRRIITSNPFGEMKGIAVQANAERFYFVTREEAYKVLEACPDAEWRLLFALSRFGGLRSRQNTYGCDGATSICQGAA